MFFGGEEGVNPHPIPVFIQSVYDRKPIALIVFSFFHCSCLVLFLYCMFSTAATGANWSGTICLVYFSAALLF